MKQSSKYSGIINIATMGMLILDIIEARDEYLVISAMQIQINRINNALIGDSPIRTPSIVAIPFPPLKLKNIGNICPITTANAPRLIAIGLNCNNLAIITINNPFSISPKSTRIAIFLSAKRATLVAPAFLEPCFLGSGNLYNLHMIMLEEIEPTK